MPPSIRELDPASSSDFDRLEATHEGRQETHARNVNVVERLIQDFPNTLFVGIRLPRPFVLELFHVLPNFEWVAVAAEPHERGASPQDAAASQHPPKLSAAAPQIRRVLDVNHRHGVEGVVPERDVVAPCFPLFSRVWIRHASGIDLRALYK